MKIVVIFIVAMSLFFNITDASYAQVMLGPGFGFSRLSEEFTDDNYGRIINNMQLITFDLSYYPNNSILGFYSKVSLGGNISGYEWYSWNNNDQVQSISDDASIFDIKLFIGPSIKFKLGKAVELPISIGPTFKVNFETIYDYSYNGKDTYYESLNLGVMGEVALLIYTVDFVYIKFGISGDYNFFRTERGEMNMGYRKRLNVRFMEAGYDSFEFAGFFGVGFVIKEN